MSSCFLRFLVSARLAAMCNCVAYADFVSPAQVAAVLGYPASKLTMSDLTKESRVRYGSDLLAAYKIESADNSFATMTFIAAKKGLILSPELEAQLKTAPSIPPAPGAKPATRRIQFGGDAYGYAGLGGGGPGGIEEMIVATLPSKGIDVQVKMEFPREELTRFPEQKHIIVCLKKVESSLRNG